MKAPTREKTEERVNLSRQFLDSKTGQEFIKWWKNHRHSGYAFKDRGVHRDERWAIEPMLACNCDRYMAEFCSDTGKEEKLRFEYSASEYERWAREQHQADEAVKRFAAAHDGREIPTPKEMEEALHLCSMFLAKKKSVKGSPGHDQDVEGYAQSTGQEWLLNELQSPTAGLLPIKRTLG